MVINGNYWWLMAINGYQWMMMMMVMMMIHDHGHDHDHDHDDGDHHDEDEDEDEDEEDDLGWWMFNGEELIYLLVIKDGSWESPK